MQQTAKRQRQQKKNKKKEEEKKASFVRWSAVYDIDNVIIKKYTQGTNQRIDITPLMWVSSQWALKISSTHAGAKQPGSSSSLEAFFHISIPPPPPCSQQRN